MRPLRLLLSLCSSLIAISLLLYVAFGSQPQDQVRDSSTVASKGRVKALFSFTSPTSLFPPSAIISLTDDNSTFFLARPAAFGPLLPAKGLSGPLWIGSGFGDEALGRGELGCSDVPGWGDTDDYSIANARVALTSDGNTQGKSAGIRDATWAKRTSGEHDAGGLDATDDHLHQPFETPKMHNTLNGKTSDHADIQVLQEAAEIAGKVVLLKRGGCGFLDKTKWAQNRGAVALIVGDDVRGGALIVMNARGDTSNITIPALFTSHTTAHLLSSLLTPGGFIQDLSAEDAAMLALIKSGKGAMYRKNQTKSGKAKSSGSRPTFTQEEAEAMRTAKTSKASIIPSEPGEQSEMSEQVGWFYSFLYALGFGNSRGRTSRGETWENSQSNQKSMRTKGVISTLQPAPTKLPGNFIIGEQDWRDPDVLPPQTSTYAQLKESTKVTQNSEVSADANRTKGKSALDEHADEDHDEPDQPDQHEGLWVTLAPTNMSSSPFFDTLLVLVVSPLVTLTVVYALLLLRSRIRRRRWRAPKSVVERLPVRTYHTISDASPSPTATPSASSPTTPLLQHPPSRPTSSLSRPQSRTTPEVPATSSSVQPTTQPTEEEKREAGLAQWRRRYGGRQRECVVCLEEYVDGISRVMSLPCGHEFHADCITPWLVTRRRTCPICKGDVVRSLSQSYRDRSLHSPSPTQPTRFFDDPDTFQDQAAETRNDSPSASRPVPISISSTLEHGDDLDADVEANWAHDDAENNEGQGREIPGDRSVDLSSSVRDLSSTVSTTIWRGFEAVRSAAGLQRRPSQGDLDRDR